MTPLEIVGALALGGFGVAMLGKLFFALFKRRTISIDAIPLDVAISQTNLAVREAFEAGMLCAADMVTHCGHEQAAGYIRKAVHEVRAANDNS